MSVSNANRYSAPPMFSGRLIIKKVQRKQANVKKTYN